MAMIFQEPMTSLNPVFTIGRQIGETLRVHRGLGRAEAGSARWRRSAWSGAGARTPSRCLSTPTLRRLAPAGDDRDGAGLRPRLLIADEPPRRST